MTDENNLQTPSVEAALAAPQNQDASSLAPRPTDTTLATGTPESLAPDFASPSSLAPRGASAAGQSDRTTEGILREAATGARGMSRMGSIGDTPAGGNALSRLVASLRGSAPEQVPQVSPAPPVQPVQPVQPVPQITEAPSAFGRGTARGYDYGGIRVELPTGFNSSDPKAVRDYMGVSNQIIDWMNEDEEV